MGLVHAEIELTNSVAVNYEVVGPLEVKFKDRTISCDAIVLPADSEPLLGAIPLEGLDVFIHPLRQELLINPRHIGLNVFKVI